MTVLGGVIGVDLGGTKILARHVDPASGKATGREKVPTPKDGPEVVLEMVAKTARKLDGFKDAATVGIGVPGFVVDHSVVLRCPNIVGWDSPVDVGAILSKELGKTVVVANDVNCGAVAEYRYGAGSEVNDMLAVFVGTGVGGGLVLDGQLRAGRSGTAGEIGHLTVVPNGRVCGCGGRGHLEAYAGRAGIDRQAKALAAAGRRNALADLAGGSMVKSRHIERALKEGDEVAQELIEDAVKALAQAIGNVGTILDLKHAVLGGGVVDKLGQGFVDQITASSAFGGFEPSDIKLVLADRLDDAGVLGAAVLAADQYL